MQIITKNFGEIEIDKDKIIKFKNGVPGFESLKEFIILSQEQDNPFKWLQSVNDPDIAFVITEPYTFMPTYNPKPSQEELLELGIKDIKEALIYTLVVIPEDITYMTANLKAPIIINTQNCKGKQIILENSNYELKHNILHELQKLKKRKSEISLATND